MLSKEIAERWLLCLQSLDRMVRKSDAHWNYGTIPDNDADYYETGLPGKPIADEDFHRLFEWAEQKIRHDCPDELPKIWLEAHDYAI